MIGQLVQAALTIVSLTGTWLNCKQRNLCFVLWIACNIGWITIDIQAGSYSRAFLDAVQIAFNIYGLWIWRKNDKQRRLQSDV